MARPKKEVVKTETHQETLHNGKTISQIIAENEAMTKQIVEMGNVTSNDPMAMKYLNEVTSIKKLARVDSDKIIVKEFADHKNISLWTKEGKRIGPMHQTNALACLQRFFNLGIMLSTHQPTADEIAAYKETDEYKVKHAAFLKKRELKDKSKKKGELEKILKQMANTYGLTMDKLTSIVRPEDVKSLAEGQKVALSS